MKNGTKSQETSLEQIGTLAGFITSFFVKVLSVEQVSYWLGHKTELKQKLCEVFAVMDEYVTLREGWQKFYKEHFKWDVDFSRVIIPPKPAIGSWRLLIIAQGMTLNKMFARMEQLFKCWKYADNLDTAVSTNVRTTASHYAVWVRDGVEPDAEFLGKSVREADPDMKIGMTLLERTTLGVKYFAETNKHLDIKGLTFCSGSLDSDGDVPYMFWSPIDDHVFVRWCYVDDSDGSHGVRQAVSA